MNEREKIILTKIGEALRHMSDFDKGYMLCLVETNANKAKEEKAELVQQ